MKEQMQEVYIVATPSEVPIEPETVAELFVSDEVSVVTDEDGVLFSLRSKDCRVDVRFEARASVLGPPPALLTGSAEAKAALARARGFYRISFVPGVPQGSLAVFEGLWTARMLAEFGEGVVVDATAFKLHQLVDLEEMTELEFDIRDHIQVHAEPLEASERLLWVHTHGLSKFGASEVEFFRIPVEDIPAAEVFLQELCTDVAFGHGPELRKPVPTSTGRAFALLPADEARMSLHGVPLEAFAGHHASVTTVVTPDGRHALAEVLAEYREHFVEETEEQARALAEQAVRLLPAFKARFHAKGLMDPLAFLVRAPFVVHASDGLGAVREAHAGGAVADEGGAMEKPPGASERRSSPEEAVDSADPSDADASVDEGADEEHLWCEVVSWDAERIVGRLVDGSHLTSEWRRGAHVEIEEAQVNAIGVSRDGDELDADELERLFSTKFLA